MRAWLAFWQGLVVLLLFGASVRGADSFTIAPPESWVIVPRVIPSHVAETNPPAGGVRLLLVDNQVNVLKKDRYHRTVKEVADANGVQACVQLSFDFDPSYESLVIHGISVHRGTNTLNRLDAAKIKVIQQERDLDRNVYNGEVSAVLFLDDVRVGDQIDFSYTIHGENPIFGDRYIGSFYPQSELPVAEEHFRLLWPAARTLWIEEHGTVKGRKKTPMDDVTEYTWDLRDVPAVVEEDSLPSWYDAAPWVQFTEFGTWQDVGQWAAQLFPRPAKLDADLQAKVNDWEQEYPQPEARLEAALKFVQNEVRYLGIEVGPNSHQPTDPAVVFARRFGDCKDKAYLFCSLLQAMNITATEALVQTEYNNKIADWLPTPYAFDHVVARVELNGRVYWLDPTESTQGGAIGDRFFPDYGECLLVGPVTTNLTTIPQQTAGWPKTDEHETFLVHDQKKPADLTIQTIARGLDADRVRGMFADSGREEMEKRYLNYYAREYPKIKTARPLEILDDPDRNIFKMVEHYQIDEFWKLDDDKKNYECEFDPQVIRDLMEEPNTTLRSMPLDTSYPHHELLETEVILPEAWPVDEKKDDIANVAARLQVSRQTNSDGFVMKYEFTALTNRVMPDEMPEYVKSVGLMKEALGYSLTWGNKDLLDGSDKAATASNTDAGTGGGFNWSIACLAVMYCLLLTGAAVFLHEYRRGKVPPPLPNEATRHLVGLGGWLILVAIGLFCTPLRVLVFLAQNYTVYGADSWHTLTDPSGASYNGFWAPLLIFELLSNLTSILLSAFALVLFFERRRIFRPVYIVFLLTNLLCVALDHFAIRLMPAAHSSLTDGGGDPLLMQTTIGTLIWVPYMLRSRRAKATFTR